MPEMVRYRKKATTQSGMFGLVRTKTVRAEIAMQR
jgi:hypothetical protein